MAYHVLPWHVPRFAALLTLLALLLAIAGGFSSSVFGATCASITGFNDASVVNNSVITGAESALSTIGNQKVTTTALPIDYGPVLVASRGSPALVEWFGFSADLREEGLTTQQLILPMYPSSTLGFTSVASDLTSASVVVPDTALGMMTASWGTAQIILSNRPVVQPFTAAPGVSFAAAAPAAPPEVASTVPRASALGYQATEGAVATTVLWTAYKADVVGVVKGGDLFTIEG